MLNLVRIWILFSTLLVSAGWLLSLLGQLNRAGYAFIFGLAGIGLAVWWRNSRWRPRKTLSQLGQKFRRRFKRPAPALFLLLSVLSFLAGALYPALNYDANAYRLPRVFHWLASGQWHWIHALDSRMNIAACGFEWLSAPLVLFTHSDRCLFLINWVSFLLLPGLIFSVFIRLQVCPRVAWWWMWFLGSGWCFVLQAGSIGNDSFAAGYALAAVLLALRAREKQSVGDFWLSLLAAALLTGAKQSNLPLGLLWVLAAAPAWRLLILRPVASSAILMVGLLVSILPVSLLNYQHAGGWLPLDSAGLPSTRQFNLNPFWGVVGNAFCLTAQNLLPPFYNCLPPFYGYWITLWNEWMRAFLQTPFGSHFASFENFGFISDFYHGVAEGNAGIGLGVCLLVLASVPALCKARRVAAMIPRRSWARLLRYAPWGALIVFMAKVGTFENARLLAPYYAFLFPSFLVMAGHSQLVRQRDWQRFGLLVMVVTAILLATRSERPLFPAQTVFRTLYARHPDWQFAADEYRRYRESNYQLRGACRGYLNASLPLGHGTIGYCAGMLNVDEPGIWLARPLAKVRNITPADSPEGLRVAAMNYVVVDGNYVLRAFGGITNWLDYYHARLAGSYQFPRTSVPPRSIPDLYLIRLNELTNRPPPQTIPVRATSTAASDPGI